MFMKGPFAVTLIVCSIVAWGVDSTWPTGVVAIPQLVACSFSDFFDQTLVGMLDLTFLYFLYLSGLISSLARQADLYEEIDSQNRVYSIYVVAGATTIMSGLLSGMPILLSPEGAAACHDGAKTGLSTVVCGILFILSIFFSPIFAALPNAGTAPLLIMVGVLLFQNTARVDWHHVKSCTPAFLTLFFIPFSYNLFEGIVMGYISYLVIGIATGELWYDTRDGLKRHLPSVHRFLCPNDKDHNDDDEEEYEYEEDGETSKVVHKESTIVNNLIGHPSAHHSHTPDQEIGSDHKIRNKSTSSIYELGSEKQSISRSSEQVYEIGYNDSIDEREHEAKCDHSRRDMTSNRGLIHRTSTARQAALAHRTSADLAKPSRRGLMVSAADNRVGVSRRMSGVLARQPSTGISRRDITRTGDMKRNDWAASVEGHIMEL